MKYSPSEIINALKVIKVTCEECETCHNCPISIGNQNRCGLKYNKDGEKIMPERWKIVGEIPHSLFLH